MRNAVIYLFIGLAIWCFQRESNERFKKEMIEKYGAVVPDSWIAFIIDVFGIIIWPVNILDIIYWVIDFFKPNSKI